LLLLLSLPLLSPAAFAAAVAEFVAANKQGIMPDHTSLVSWPACVTQRCAYHFLHSRLLIAALLSLWRICIVAALLLPELL